MNLKILTQKRKEKPTKTSEEMTEIRSLQLKEINELEL
jgi:hypothetical protein